MRMSKMNWSELNNQNNQELEKLNKKNMVYFRNLAGYMRSKKLVASELELEETLAGMLSDLLEAEHQGQTAETYFGKDPQPLADEILESIDRKNVRKTVLFVIKLAVIYLTFSLNDWRLTGGGLAIPVVNLTLQLVLTVPLMFYVITLFNRSFVKRTSKGMIAVGVIWSLIAIFLPAILPDMAIFRVSKIISLFIYGIFLLVFVNELRRDRTELLLNMLGLGTLLYGVFMQLM